MHYPDQTADGPTMASVRAVPWHRLGKTVDEAMTAHEAIALGGLDWDVYTSPVSVLNANGYTESESHRAIWREDPDSGAPLILGTCGSRWHELQNREIFNICDELVRDPHGPHYETVGALGDGRKVFMALAFDRLVVDPYGANDTFRRHLLATSSHDGSGAFKLSVVVLREACTNAMDHTIKGADVTWSGRHTATLADRARDAGAALGLAFDYFDAFAAEVETLVQTPMTVDALLANVVDAMWTPPADDASARAKTISETRREDIVSIFKGATTDNIAGTAWAGFNAVTEYLDWGVTPKAKGRDVEDARAERIMTSAALGAQKQKAHDLTVAYATT